MRYQVINYDVWGNRADGFQVNSAYTTQVFIELPEDATDKQIKRALYDSGFARRGILNTKMEIEGEPDMCLYCTLTGTRYGYRPFCELRAIA